MCSLTQLATAAELAGKTHKNIRHGYLKHFKYANPILFFLFIYLFFH